MITSILNILFLNMILKRHAYFIGLCHAHPPRFFRSQGTATGSGRVPSFRNPKGEALSSLTSRLWAGGKSLEKSPTSKERLCLSMIASEASSIVGPSSVGTFGGLTYRVSAGENRVLFVLGGPGAGKGTQCDLLIQNFPCVHLSAGELLRAETSKADSPHAELIEQCLVSGKIVPVEISLSLLENAMKQAQSESIIFLIDGFPRNFDNLEGWTRCMKDVASVWGVLVYHCPLTILEERILERGKDSGRSDDNLESLRRRFRTFETDTIPVIDTLRLIGENSLLNVFDVGSDKPLDAVWEETQQVMNSIVANDVISANVQLLHAIAETNISLYSRLCGEKMLGPSCTVESMLSQEALDKFPDSSVENAALNFISGTKVALAYDRVSKSSLTFRETRIWSHDGKGWRMVHFSRAPAVEQ